MTPHAPQNNGFMDPDPKGMWFHAGEVEALEAGLAKLEAELEQWKTGSAHEAHFGDEARRDLAAATATLDRLREVVNKWMEFDGFTAYDVMDAIRPILYQTPEIPIKPKESHCLPCKWCGEYTYNENDECDTCQKPENDNEH